MQAQPVDMAGEVWRDVPGYEGAYRVSSLGRVKSVSRVIERSNGRRHTVAERVLKGGKSKGLVVTLNGHTGSITTRAARLVWSAFVGPIPQGQSVLHRDGDALNSALSNLVLGDSASAERLKAERNGGADPMARSDRVMDAHWSTDAQAQRRCRIS